MVLTNAIVQTLGLRLSRRKIVVQTSRRLEDCPGQISRPGAVCAADTAVCALRSGAQPQVTGGRFVIGLTSVGPAPTTASATCDRGLRVRVPPSLRLCGPRGNNVIEPTKSDT